MDAKFWFVTLTLGAAVGLAATTACSNNANSSSSSEAASSAGTSAAGTQSTATAPPAMAKGAQIYNTNCSSCHQSNGQGVPGAFPPLASNPAVSGDPKTVVHIVKFGLTGPVAVAGKTYNGTMPPWNALGDADVASVVTFIRSTWGNSASAVTAADVTAVKR